MSDHEFERALGYASAALDFLKRSGIPPHPPFFELLYTYAAGVNPSLNARINALVRAGTTPTRGLMESLYSEFMKADASDRISDVSERMHQRIEAVHVAIDSAMLSANAYSGSLQVASGDLEHDMSATAMKMLAETLLTETRRMQDNNRQLEAQLEASRQDIEALQRDMDDVRRESLLDPLTKIANRKSFDEGLAAALEDAALTGQPLCLIFADIDNFKLFNDTYGHQTGDQVLRLVAMTIKSNIKGKDLAARYGGEEFAAILPCTDLKGATAAAENIREAVQSKDLVKRSTNEKLGRITASFGVAAHTRGDTATSLIERADKCLYAAKHAGRNRVVNESELAKLSAA
ncbi:GGDEF domain-containing protein [Devosia albogilva]|uniref:diguanylate cyclase n=1 Tax=Devosia albogilva TaxID=429726 RepID=A0ABW5QQ32_9HYPH